MKRLVLLAALPLAACAGAPVVVANASSCIEYIPPAWEKGVAGAPLPEGDTVGDWVAFGDATVGKLDQSNERMGAVFHICRTVDKNNARAVKRGSRGFFGRLFG